MWCDQNAGCRRANVAIVLKNKWNTRPVGWFVNKFVVVGEFERKCRMLLLLFSAGERVSVWWRNIVRFVRRSLHVQCAQTITLYWTAAAAYSWHVFQSGDEERGVRLFPPLRPLLGPSGDGGKGSIRGGGVWEFRRRRERERERAVWPIRKKLHVISLFPPFVPFCSAFSAAKTLGMTRQHRKTGGKRQMNTAVSHYRKCRSGQFEKKSAVFFYNGAKLILNNFCKFSLFGKDDEK